MVRYVAAFGTGEHGLLFHTEGRPVDRSMALTYIRTSIAAADRSAKVAERLGHDLKTLLQTHAHVMPKE